MLKSIDIDIEDGETQIMLKDEGNKAKADTLRFAIAHMRVGRSGMCLKDRECPNGKCTHRR